MKLLLYSDLHVGDLWLDKIETATKFLSHVIEEEKPDAIINLGDTFHSKGSATAKCVSTLTRWFETLPNIPHYILFGNHDSVDGSAVTDAFGLHPTTTCVSESTRIEIQSIPIYLIPYSDTSTVDVGDALISCSHIPLAGAKLTQTRIEEHGHEIVGANLQLRLSGHYHLPQAYRGPDGIPTVIVGAPDYYSWADQIAVDGENSPSPKIIPRGAVLLTLEGTQLRLQRRANPYATLRAVWSDSERIGEGWTAEARARAQAALEALQEGLGAALLARWDYHRPELAQALHGLLGADDERIRITTRRQSTRLQHQPSEQGEEEPNVAVPTISEGDALQRVRDTILHSYDPTEARAMLDILQEIVCESKDGKLITS